jgi:hypothetical protein
MNKALSILLALVMAVSLFACNKTTPPATTAPAVPDENNPVTTPDADNPDAPDVPETPIPENNPGKQYPNANPDGSVNLDTIAHFDDSYDYTQNEKFKIAYIAFANMSLYERSANAFEHWATLFNMEWAGFFSADGDNDLFLTNFLELIDQGVTGFILDPDTVIFQFILEILENHPEVKWMSCVSPPRDGATGANAPLGGNLLHP